LKRPGRYIALAFGCYIGCIIALIKRNEWVPNLIYYIDRKDIFMDFFNLVYWSDRFEAFTEWKSIYPPVIVASVGRGEQLVQLVGIDGFELRSHAGFTVFATTAIVTALTTWMMWSEVLRGRLGRQHVKSAAASLISVASPWMLFAFDRLNTVIGCYWIISLLVGILARQANRIDRLGVGADKGKTLNELTRIDKYALIAIWVCALIKPYFWIVLLTYTGLQMYMSKSFVRRTVLVGALGLLYFGINELAIRLFPYEGSIFLWANNMVSFSSDTGNVWSNMYTACIRCITELGSERLGIGKKLVEIANTGSSYIVITILFMITRSAAREVKAVEGRVAGKERLWGIKRSISYSLSVLLVTSLATNGFGWYLYIVAIPWFALWVSMKSSVERAQKRAFIIAGSLIFFASVVPLYKNNIGVHLLLAGLTRGVIVICIIIFVMRTRFTLDNRNDYDQRASSEDKTV